MCEGKHGDGAPELSQLLPQVLVCILREESISDMLVSLEGEVGTFAGHLESEFDSAVY